MEQVLQVNVIAVTFVASWLIPLTVALLTKSTASSSVKAFLNLVLTVATGVCACVIQAKGSVTVGQITTAVMAAFTGSGLSYTHLWKPTGAAASVNAVAPEFGLGSTKVIDVSSTETPAPKENPLDPVETPLPGSVPAPADPPDGEERIAPLSAAGARVLADNSLFTGDSILVLLTPVVTSPETD